MLPWSCRGSASAAPPRVPPASTGPALLHAQQQQRVAITPRFKNTYCRSRVGGKALGLPARVMRAQFRRHRNYGGSGQGAGTSLFFFVRPQGQTEQRAAAVHAPTAVFDWHHLGARSDGCHSVGGRHGRAKCRFAFTHVVCTWMRKRMAPKC